MTRILVIEDDEKISKLLAADLELEGYIVNKAKDGVEGLERAKSLKPNLIILDVMLPRMNGYDVCRALRRDKSDIPIIMLTAKGHEAEKVFGLELGADDYVTKPYSGIELMARVKALLRRHKREVDKATVLKIDDLSVDFTKRTAARKGKDIDLTQLEYSVLELLVRCRGEVVSRQQFLEEVWGFGEEMPTTRTIDTRVKLLRQKLFGRDTDEYIVSVHGVGYKFVG